MRPIRAHDGGRTGTAAREGLAHNSIASWQMGLAAVLCNSEVLMQEVDIKLRRYYDSSTMRPISIVDVPTLYNGMTVLFFSERVSAALKRYPAPFELETCGCCEVFFVCLRGVSGKGPIGGISCCLQCCAHGLVLKSRPAGRSLKLPTSIIPAKGCTT